MAESLTNLDIPNRSDMVQLLWDKMNSIFSTKNIIVDLHKFILSVHFADAVFDRLQITKEKSETQKYDGFLEFHAIITAIIHIIEKLVSLRPLSIEILINTSYVGGEIFKKVSIEKEKVIFDILLGNYPTKLAHTIVLEKLNIKYKGNPICEHFKSVEFLDMLSNRMADIMKQDQFRMAGQLQIAEAVLIKLA